MRSTRVLGVIPARLGSERLPRKPLQPLGGRPLIERVWRRVRSFEAIHHVVVATDSEEVASICLAAGAAVELTAADHGSGTERVAEVATRFSHQGFGVVVNVQGDEPFIGEPEVAAAVALVRAGWEIGTAATPVRSLEDWRSESVVKVVRRDDAAALYFTRSAVPHRRGSEPDVNALASARYLRHVGVYAYTPGALARWVGLPPHPLEEEERLEQLRPLMAGLRIGVAVVAKAEKGIDTPAELAAAESRLRTTATSSPGGGESEA